MSISAEERERLREWAKATLTTPVGHSYVDIGRLALKALDALAEAEAELAAMRALVKSREEDLVASRAAYRLLHETTHAMRPVVEAAVLRALWEERGEGPGDSWEREAERLDTLCHSAVLSWMEANPAAVDAWREREERT